MLGFCTCLVECKSAMKEKLICELKSFMESFQHLGILVLVFTRKKRFLKFHDHMMHVTALAKHRLSRNGMQHDVTALDPRQPPDINLSWQFR